MTNEAEERFNNIENPEDRYNKAVQYVCRSVYISNHIRLSEQQLPVIYEMLTSICNDLEIKVPELFVQADPTPNAYTMGDQNPCIVLTSGLVDCLGVGPELRVVLSHECGHILCKHVCYTTMVQMMLNLAAKVTSLGAVVTALQEPLLLAYNRWSRASEFTADRISSVVAGGVATTAKTILRLAGGGASTSILSQIDATSYIDQMMECEQMGKDAKAQALIKEFSEMDDEHPYTVTRIRELVLWGKSEEYRKLVTTRGCIACESGNNRMVAKRCKGTVKH